VRQTGQPHERPCYSKHSQAHTTISLYNTEQQPPAKGLFVAFYE
jgi:hypothetical protein